jgi:hypothetical protein
VPDADRQRAEHELEGQRRFLKVAVYVGPLFGDASKLLVSDQPFSELDLLNTTEGERIAPPRPERVLLPGTPVRVDKVEFPTGWIPTQRVLMTPRYHAWVYLALAGERRPLVLVLPQTLKSAEDVTLEVERVLGASDPSPVMRALPEPQRAAISRKELTDAMTPQAVVMAWGYPDRKTIDRPARTEEWRWPGDRRKARFEDERLVSWDDR